MSRYSSNFPRSDFEGRSRKTRPPSSTSPLSLSPKISVCPTARVGRRRKPPRTHPARANPNMRLIMALLALEPARGRWVVGAMDLAMAVGAGAIEDKPHLGVCLGSGRVAALHVALLAEPWFGDLEELLVVGSVGLVAVGAALRRRRMLPEEGAALLRMAGVAVLVNGVGLEELLRRRAVGVVAGHAVHLPFPERHVGRAHELGLALEVALPAGFDHSGLGELTSLGDVYHHPMAVGAGDVTRGVRASLPVEAGSLFVALEADGVALLHRRRVFRAEGDEPAHALASACIHVGLARAVARLAAESLLSVSRMLQEEFPHGGRG